MKKIYLILSFAITSMLVSTLFTEDHQKTVQGERKDYQIFSQRKSYVKGKVKMDSPNLFADFQRKIRTEFGSSKSKYPSSYKIKELAKARKNSKLYKKNDLNFISRGPGNVGGRSRGVIIDPDDATANTWLVAAVGGGVWKTTDAGSTWKELTIDSGSLSASYMAMAPSNHNIIYLGTGEGFGNLDALGGQGIWKSLDKGLTWSKLENTSSKSFGIINRIIVDPTNPDIVLAVTSSQDGDSGIYKSIDGGVSWISKYSNPRFIQQIINDPNNFAIQYATVYGYGIMRSTDSGENWSKISNINEGRIELAISSVSTSRLYASVSGNDWDGDDTNDKSEIYLSLDGGNQWDKLVSNVNFLGGQGWYDNAIIVDPFDENTFFVAGINIYKVKYNGGSSITVTTLTDNYGNNPALHKGTHVDNHFFAITKLDESKGTFRLVGTNDGGVCYTDDEGITFTQPITGFVTSQFYGIDKANGKDLYIGGMQDNSCYASPINPSSDDNWKFAFGGDGFDVVWNYEDENKVMLTSQYNNIAITHSGIDKLNQEIWFADVDNGSDNSPFFTKLAQSKHYSDLVFTYGENGVWRTEDFGVNWTNIEMSSGYEGKSSTTDIKISLADSRIVWTGGSITINNSMFVSTDFGKTFSQVAFSTLAKGSLSGLATHPVEKNTAYALFSTYGNPKIVRTKDLGQTWEDISGFESSETSTNGFPNVAVFDLLVLPYGDHNTLWAGTEIGIFESTDDGVSWHYLNNGLPPVSVYDLLVVNDEVIIGTHGRGVWTVSLSELENYEPTISNAPVGLTASYLFDGSNQLADIELYYRSEYQSVKVYIEDVLLEEITDVVARDRYYLKGSIAEGENIIKVVSEVGGEVFETKAIVEGLPLKTASKVFISDFNNMGSITDEFSGNGFSISKPSGFDDNAINSLHPYAPETTYDLYLNTPIIVNKDKPSFSYKDVAIVEPGENGTAYPNEEFWDYVTIEGSTDGQNWTKMVTPYDARFNAGWLSKYNSSSNPDKTNFVSHTFKTTDFFNDGEVILIRFGLFSDQAATGWGWIIDDLQIQKDALSLEDNFLSTQFKVYPNPVVDEVLYLESTTDSKIISVELYNLSGQVLLNKKFAKVEKAKLSIPNFAKGQYFIKVETDKGAFSKKIMVE